MASATMGLRRRVPVNNSPTPSGQSASAGGSSSTSGSKRSRTENNNSPSHGNLNSMHRDEPPAKKSRGTSTNATKNSSSSSNSTSPETSPSSKSRGGSVSRSNAQSGKTSAATSSVSSTTSDAVSNSGVLVSNNWQTSSNMSDVSTYASVAGLSMGSSPTGGLCAGSLSMTTPIPYMSSSMATFVGNATNLGKSSSVSYLDISNMTGGSLSSSAGLNAGYVGNGNAGNAIDSKNGVPMPFPGMTTAGVNGTGPGGYAGMQKGQPENAGLPKKFQSDGMFNAYQPWVIKTYGDLAKTKTITIKKYARILRTLRGEEVNSAENSKFRFWVKSKGFHIGQPEGYDAKPADRIIGRHAVTSPGLDPPLYVPTQLPHNKTLNGAEGTVPPGRVYKKVAIVENFFDIIHAVHVDLEGRPGKHAGQKRTYRTITETYAFLPREAVTRFLLGCTECQRRPRTPSPTNLSNQPQPTSATPLTTSTLTSTATPLSPNTLTTASTTSVQSSPKLREGNHNGEGKPLYSYRHQRHQKGSTGNNAVSTSTTTTTTTTSSSTTTTTSTQEKADKEKEEKYNPLSITNLLKKEPVAGSFLPSADSLPDSRRTPESDRASSRSSASSKRKRMLPEGRTPSPQPSQPLPRPWSPGLDPKNTPIDYSLPITTSYLKHQQRLLQQQAEKNKAAAIKETELEQKVAAAILPPDEIVDTVERDRYSPATGLIDTNLNLLATIQHLHCQVMLALTERLRPSITMPSPLVLPTAANVLTNGMMIGSEVSVQTGENRT
ncbi:mucin-5AC-like [Frieseomelitta varia]|uniref:mucin-5AC-like n=1 Tax=Frieseomelitta varia TaxID=561572 RepID=UPI001CB67CC9|nr:mucin-5AC-like [Frieseomelitta varia]XP_043527394.1 mucin-5AC-like [Frieseomelitta varia]XP_043527395.1 mucin-5AC-like [Frieseomelitta varia]XP_043527396.1 mucin-5AC-like [Frieseomelitta varia]